ncbi:MAG: disulfide bond formation protein B [Planctomycetota bacterium]|nr:MAG: disulfide bond formation protein B [Planctomycetota bacterium]
MTDSTSLEHSIGNSSTNRAMIFRSSAIQIAVVGAAGSVFLSVGQGLKACPLCFYQRSFVMAVLAVLALGRFLERSRPGLICLLSVPLAWAGLGVAVFHYYLVATKVLECPQGLFGFGTAPAQSLMLFNFLASDVSVGAWYGRHESPRQRATTQIAAVLLGFVLAVACVKSAPPLPKVPAAAYDPVKDPLDTCRRPFRAPTN